MLDKLGETQPVVLVGHSNGAFYAETFAIKFPQRVAGVAYVDGVGTDDLDNPRVMSNLATEETLARIAVWAGRTGLTGAAVRRLTEAMGLQGQAATHKEQALSSLRHLTNARDEVLDIIPALSRVRALGAVSPAIPTVVIVASLAPDDPDEQAWRAMQVAPARRACQGWVLDAVGSSHVAPLGRDRAYVLAAVRWLQTPGLGSAQTCSDLTFRR
jgi:pimeloyl-ACP methyl ester carboxylesterase